MNYKQCLKLIHQHNDKVLSIYNLPRLNEQFIREVGLITEEEAIQLIHKGLFPQLKDDIMIIEKNPRN